MFPRKDWTMTKSEAISTLMQVTDEELTGLDTERLKDILGSLRYVIRQVEREVIRREVEQGLYFTSRN